MAYFKVGEPSQPKKKRVKTGSWLDLSCALPGPQSPEAPKLQDAIAGPEEDDGLHGRRLQHEGHVQQQAQREPPNSESEDGNPNRAELDQNQATDPSQNGEGGASAGVLTENGPLA